MKRMLLMFAAVILLAGASIETRSLAYGQRIDFKYDIILQDEATGNYLCFSSLFGNYKFVRCNDGVYVTGRGVVKRDGCNVSLTDISETRKVLASIDECAMQGKAVIGILEGTKLFPEMEETLFDPYLRDNIADCEKGIKK